MTKRHGTRTALQTHTRTHAYKCPHTIARTRTQIQAGRQVNRQTTRQADRRAAIPAERERREERNRQAAHHITSIIRKAMRGWRFKHSSSKQQQMHPSSVSVCCHCREQSPARHQQPITHAHITTRGVWMDGCPHSRRGRERAVAHQQIEYIPSTHTHTDASYMPSIHPSKQTNKTGRQKGRKGEKHKRHHESMCASTWHDMTWQAQTGSCTHRQAAR
mmetsp:Transcript_21194/g.51753  ORF Transcript_21194/g.51753 Transcript_21194/m.51753 type:complete len:218 (+) Transcript_21194:59-712(+)